MRKEQQLKKLCKNTLKLKVEVLIPEEIKAIKESIEFKRKTISSYKNDIKNLKDISFFTNYVHYKLQAIKNMENLIIKLEQQLISCNVEIEMILNALKDDRDIILDLLDISKRNLMKYDDEENLEGVKYWGKLLIELEEIYL